MFMHEAFDSICYKGSMVSQSARFVYLCLCKHADNTNQTCFPSLARIAEIVGKSISTIKRAIRELCKFGAIERTSRFRKDGGQTSNLYKIVECDFSGFEEEQEVNEDKANNKMPGIDEASFSVSEPDEIECSRACSTAADDVDQELTLDNNIEIKQNEDKRETECNISPQLILLQALKDNDADIDFICGNTELLKHYNQKFFNLRHCKNKFFHWTKNKYLYIKSRFIRQVEPGGGRERPAKNLSI